MSDGPQAPGGPPSGESPGRSLPASADPPAPQPLIAPTGSPGLNSVLDVVNATAAPFMNAPPKEQGAAGYVSQGISGITGVIGAPAQLIDTAFAVMTAPIAALFPAMPAITLLGLHLGTPHGHTHPPSLIPPAPAPIPLPSMGVLVGAGSMSVLLGGMPAARAGDIGLAVTCGSLAPPFEVFTGSSNVFIGGARAARMLDITKHCNPGSMGPFAIAMAVAGVVGGAAGAIATSNVNAGMQAAADAAVLAIKLLVGKDPGIPPGIGTLLGPPVPNVLIGGFPCPPVGEMAWGGILKALKAAAKALKKRSSRAGNGKTCEGSEPIYLVTGENYNTFLDFDSCGLFVWRRHYTSARGKQDSPLGPGWRHFYQRTLKVRLHRATFTNWDGDTAEFPRFERGSDVVTVDGYVLERLAPGHYRLSFRNDPVMYFVGDPFQSVLSLSKITEPDREIAFTYDELGRLVTAVEWNTKTDQRRCFGFRYAESGHIAHLLEMLVPQSGRSDKPDPIVRASYRRDETFDLIAATDALGGNWYYEYDAFHRLTKEVDPRGYTYTFRYDAAGRCIHAAGQDGLWTATMEYFPEERFTRYTEGDDATWEYHYDADGFVTKRVDPYGGVKIRERDGDGKLAREVDSGGRELRWLYDANEAHVARVDRFGNVFPPEVDLPILPNPFARTLPSTSIGYLYAGVLEPSMRAAQGLDPATLYAIPRDFATQASLCFRARPLFDAPSSSTPALPRVERDLLGRKIRETDELGRVQEWAYDETGNVIRHRDRDGQVSTRTTVSWNLLGLKSNPLGFGIQYEYSQLEQIVGIKDALGNESSYRYDLKERLVEVHRHGRVREHYEYDKGDHFIEKRDGNGVVLFTNTIHDNHLVALRQLRSGGVHRFDYDQRGRIIEASTERHDVHRAYQGLSGIVRDVHDGAGVEHYEDGPAWVTSVFERFSLRGTWSPGHAELVDPTGQTTIIDHDGYGGVTRRCSNGTVEVAQYGVDGHLTGQVAYRYGPWSHPQIRCIAHVYSAEGDLLRTDDSERGSTTYVVDPAHRLTSEITPQGRRHEFSHDAADNLLVAPGSGALIGIQAGNRLTNVAGEQFEYNERDHIAVRRAPDGRTTKYVYDSFDMLVRVEGFDANGSLISAWDATYDAIGRRITSRQGDTQREFYWDEDRIAAEVFPDGRLRIYQYATSKALVPIAFTEYEGRDAEPSSGRTYQVFTNPVGMPTCIENDRGEVVWWATRIDPFGTIEIRADAQIEYNLRWPGHYFDPETGLHYNRYRYYDPSLGRYLQSDPTGYAGSPYNLYSYCANPLVQVDILGLDHKNKDSKTTSEEGENDGREGTKFRRVNLDDMSPEQLPQYCREAAAELKRRMIASNAISEGFTTLAVVVIRGPDGKRKAIITTSDDSQRPPHNVKTKDIGQFVRTPPTLVRAQRAYDSNGKRLREPVVGADGKQKLHPKTGKPMTRPAWEKAPPGEHFVRTPDPESPDGVRYEPYKKTNNQNGYGDDTSSLHHAEQRAQTYAEQHNSTIEGMKPTKPCCTGCQKALGESGLQNIPDPLDPP